MKKWFLMLLFLSFNINYAQSTYEIEQIEKSEDPKILSNFIINNPNHPSIPKLKQKLTHLVIQNKSNPTPSVQKTQKKTPNSHQQTEDILNHLLRDHSNKSKNAYISIRNLSQCGISVVFNGIKTYTIDIAPKSTGRLLVDKGNYNISSKVCNANYNANKDIASDFEMSLNNITSIKKS